MTSGGIVLPDKVARALEEWFRNPVPIRFSIIRKEDDTYALEVEGSTTVDVCQRPHDGEALG